MIIIITTAAEAAATDEAIAVAAGVVAEEISNLMNFLLYFHKTINNYLT